MAVPVLALGVASLKFAWNGKENRSAAHYYEFRGPPSPATRKRAKRGRGARHSVKYRTRDRESRGTFEIDRQRDQLGKLIGTEALLFAVASATPAS